MTLRTAAWLLLLACSACRTAQTEEEHPAPGPPAIVVHAAWETEDGDQLLVGGVFCQLFRPEGTEPEHWGVTDGLEPLVFEDVQPGPYRLVVLGRDGLELGKEIELPPGRRLTVRVDVQAALSDGGPTTQAQATARRAIYVHEPGTGDHVGAQPVTVLEPGRLQLSTELHASR